MDAKTTKKLDAVAADPGRVTKINLSECYDLRDVPPVIQQCTALEDLDLSFTSIGALPEWLFALPKLKRLMLAYTNDPAFPTGLLTMAQLREVSLSLDLAHVPPDEFFELPSLTKLTLIGPMVTLPDAIERATSLTELHLFCPELRTVPDSMGDLAQLTTLSISTQFSTTDDQPTGDIDVSQIVGVLARCPKLTDLQFTTCGIAAVPTNINGLKTLKRLSFSGNLLTDYPVELYELTSLRELDLGVNQIGKVHPGIAALTKLQVLALNSNWKNKLDTTALFAEIDQLAQLKDLELWSCLSVASLPETIGAAPRLTKLNLDNNVLTSLPDAIFSMTGLKYLNVANNPLPASIIDRLKSSLPNTKLSVPPP
jgi:Leucine-rich repeat (LRR) protein